jgi:hypothetical protein
MSDIKLDDSGDIDLTNMSMTLVTGQEAIAQEIRISMRFFKGEWFLDTRIGIPYFQSILGEKPSEETVATIYRQALLSIPGVKTVDSVVVTLSDRTATVAWRCLTDDGEVIENTEALVLP